MQNIPSWFLAAILVIIVSLGSLMLFNNMKIEIGHQKFGFYTPPNHKVNSNEISLLNQRLQKLNERIQIIEKADYQNKIDELMTQISQLNEKISQSKKNFSKNKVFSTIVFPRLSSIEILTEPKFDKGIVTWVNKGSKLVVLDKKESWYQVETSDGQIGWISEKWVSE